MLRYNVFQNIIKRLSFILVVVGTILPTSWSVMADCCDTCGGTGCFDAPNPPPCQANMNMRVVAVMGVAQ